MLLIFIIVLFIILYLTIYIFLLDSYIVHTETDYVKDLLLGFQEERRMIDHYEQSERISIIEANELRKNVNLLESYSISGEVNNVPLKRFVKNFNKE